MRVLLWVLLAITIAAAMLVLGLSAWPGLLGDLVLWSIVFLLICSPLVALMAVVFAIMVYRRYRQGRLSPFPKCEAVAIPIIMAAALTLLVLQVPLRVAFLLSQSAFEQAVAAAPTSPHGGGTRLGLYKVDEFAAAPCGGVFFRVYAAPDGISPDTMSYGFAYQPNPQTTPFGTAHYSVSHLWGDWYTFEASNDWF